MTRPLLELALKVKALDYDGVNFYEFRRAERDLANEYPRIIELCEALEGLLNCPVIADGDINSASWGCPESAAAVARANRALNGE